MHPERTDKSARVAYLLKATSCQLWSSWVYLKKILGHSWFLTFLFPFHLEKYSYPSYWDKDVCICTISFYISYTVSPNTFFHPKLLFWTIKLSYLTSSCNIVAPVVGRTTVTPLTNCVRRTDTLSSICITVVSHMTALASCEREGQQTYQWGFEKKNVGDSGEVTIFIFFMSGFQFIHVKSLLYCFHQIQQYCSLSFKISEAAIHTLIG